MWVKGKHVRRMNHSRNEKARCLSLAAEYNSWSRRVRWITEVTKSSTTQPREGQTENRKEKFWGLSDPLGGSHTDLLGIAGGERKRMGKRSYLKSEWLTVFKLRTDTCRWRNSKISPAEYILGSLQFYNEDTDHPKQWKDLKEQKSFLDVAFSIN